MTNQRLRVDKWLWYARCYKSRAYAQKCIQCGDIRINQDRISDPAKLLKIGDILTLSSPQEIKVICVEQLGKRRGPATEARQLYSVISQDLLPRDYRSFA